VGGVEPTGEVVVSRGGSGAGIECGAPEVVWGERHLALSAAQSKRAVIGK